MLLEGQMDFSTGMCHTCLNPGMACCLVSVIVLTVSRAVPLCRLHGWVHALQYLYC